MEENIKKLEYAKKAIISCLENANCNVDFHGLAYWASVVERVEG
jgi:hypothetical protein